jgi:nicotinate-nucleotide adenylyltransferase
MVILYGGAFNPPTIAHLEIIKHILATFDCELLILPTNNFYNKKDLVDFHHRVKMLELLCQEVKGNIIISDYELTLDKYYGTYYTLKHFNHPYFVIGADALKDINKWICYPKVVIENKFIVIPRDDININEIINSNSVLKDIQNNFIILDGFAKIHMSSSMFREEYNPRYVLDSVLKYIKDNKLYEVV